MLFEIPSNLLALLLCLFVILAATGFGLAQYFKGRVRTVKEGHVAVLQWMDRFSRTVGPGPYWLRPFEEEVTQVYVRQREATISLPKIFTDGGLSVTVDLHYAYRLDPEHMEKDELYYSETERKKQQEMLMREALLDLLQELQSSTAAVTAAQGGSVAAEDMGRLDVVALFSPFAGPKEIMVRSKIKACMSKVLLPHGIVITNAPVQIAGLNLPPGLSAAYGEYVEARFSGAARSEFIRRVRAAGANMTEAGLVQLLNIIQNPSADIHTIFSSGTVNQEMLLEANAPVVRHQFTGTAPQPPPATQSGTAPPAIEAPGTDDQEAGQDYPLVESDNALLKSTRGEQYAGG